MQANLLNNSLGKFVTHQVKKQISTVANHIPTEKPFGLVSTPLILPIKRRVRSLEKLAHKIKHPALTETKKLENMAYASHHVLKTATTVFPFVLFPDTVQIDRQKLTIIHRSAFRTARTSSISLKDVQNVEGNVGPLFGSLVFTSKFFKNNTQSIKFLHRKDVTDIQHLLQGYMVAIHGGIDIAAIPSDKLLMLLTDLGKSKN
jgi:hypothetical protein